MKSNQGEFELGFLQGDSSTT